MAKRDKQIRSLQKEKRRLESYHKREEVKSASSDTSTILSDQHRDHISEINKYRNETIEAKEEIIYLRTLLKQKDNEAKEYLKDQKQLQGQVNSQKHLLSGLKRKIAEVTNAAEQSEKQMKNGIGLQYELELENQR